MSRVEREERRINEWILTIYNSDTSMAVGVYPTFNAAEMVGTSIVTGRDSGHRGYSSYKVKAYDLEAYCHA